MANIIFPFGKEKISYDIDDARLCGVLTSSLHSYKALDTEENLVKAAMASPYGSETSA